MEQRVVQETGKALPAPSADLATPVAENRGRFRELWSKKYAPRTVMLVIFHLAQAVGLYGFSNWAPTFLIKRGSSVSSSLAHGLVIACMTPLGPLLAMTFADRIERKWQIVVSALVVCAAGLAFAEVRNSVLIILCGGLVTVGATIISLNFHAYQSELFPTRIRALAVGFVYSASRVSGMFSGFLIAFALAQRGVSAALALIAGCMALVALAIGVLGPKTRGRSLEDLND
jgi:putative MFS transporter